MNFLAHLHLSYPNHPQMVGNFIGDYVKGKRYVEYHADIARGIMLHRKIDSYTDAHILHKTCRDYFRGVYGLYSGVVVDMLFDHFLAAKWDCYSTLSLDDFAQLSYSILYDYHDILPTRVQGFLPKMKAIQRLESYAKLSGLEEALSIMSKYTSLPAKSKEAMEVINTNYKQLEDHFIAFYAELQNSVKKEITI